MKKSLLVAAILSLTSAAFAQIPPELQNLIPVGTDSIRLTGSTNDGQKCIVNFSSKMGIFSSSVIVVDGNNQILNQRIANFQIGFGHELQKVSQQSDTLTAVSTHQAEEEYSSDTREALKVHKSRDEIASVQMKNEEKFLLMYTTKSDETCNLK